MSTPRRDRNSGGPVPSITTASPPVSQDRARRGRVYVIQMSIRVACFIAAFCVGGGWPMWTLFAASAILPYTAVLFANAGPQQSVERMTPMQWRQIQAAGPRADQEEEDGGRDPGIDGTHL